MKARSLFRVLRWVGLGAAVPALWACTSRSLEAPLVKPEQTFTKTFQQTVNRNVDLLFLIDDSSSMRLSQQNLETNFPQFMRALEAIPGGLPNVHIGVISSDMGAGRRLDLGLRGHRQGRHLPVHGARRLHGDQPAGGRDVHLERRRRRQLHGQPGERLHLHRGARRERLRLRAPVRGDHARARRRRQRRPARARTSASCARTRTSPIILITNEDDCSARRRLAAVRHDAKPDPRQPARATLELPLQRVRPPLRRRRPQPQRAERHGDRHARTTRTASRPRAPACSRPSATRRRRSRRSRTIRPARSSSPPSLARRRPTRCTGRTRGPPTPARGPRSRTRARAGHQLRRPVGARDRVRAAVRRQRPDAVDLRQQLRAGADAHRQEIGRALEPPLHQRPVANKPGTNDPDCTVVSHTGNGNGMIIDTSLPWCNDVGGAGPCWELVPA